MCANFSFKQEDELQSLGSFMSILNDSKMGVFSIFCMSGSPCEGGAMFLMKYCFFGRLSSNQRCIFIVSDGKTRSIFTPV